MPGAGIYLNTLNVQFLPNGGSLLNLTQITDISTNDGGEVVSFVGDAGRFKQAMKLVAQTRIVTLHTANKGQLNSIVLGVPGTLSWVDGDFYNGAQAGGGGIQNTLTNAMPHNRDASGRINTIKDGVITFEAYAPDGATDPLTMAAV